MTLRWEHANKANKQQTRGSPRPLQQTNGNRAIWLLYRRDKNARTPVDFGWFSECPGEKTSRPRTFEKSPVLRFDVILQHDRPIEQSLPHIRVFFLTRKRRVHILIFSFHPLAEKAKNECLPKPVFLRSYENSSITRLEKINTSLIMIQIWFISYRCVLH